MTAYGDRSALKVRMGLEAGDTSQDAALDSLLEQMARYLDAQCERDFFRHPTTAVEPDETRIVRARGRSSRLGFRSGIVTLTSLESADSPAGPWTVVAAADYTFEPWDLPPDETYEQLLLLEGKWDAGFYRATGHFGFAAPPAMIVDANLDGARELHRQGPGGGAPVGVNQFGTPMFLRGTPKSVLDAIARYAWRNRDFSAD